MALGVPILKHFRVYYKRKILQQKLLDFLKQILYLKSFDYSVLHLEHIKSFSGSERM